MVMSVNIKIIILKTLILDLGQVGTNVNAYVFNSSQKFYYKISTHSYNKKIVVIIVSYELTITIGLGLQVQLVQLVQLAGFSVKNLINNSVRFGIIFSWNVTKRNLSKVKSEIPDFNKKILDIFVFEFIFLIKLFHNKLTVQ